MTKDSEPNGSKHSPNLVQQHWVTAVFPEIKNLYPFRDLGLIGVPPNNNSKIISHRTTLLLSNLDDTCSNQGLTEVTHGQPRKDAHRRVEIAPKTPDKSTQRLVANTSQLPSLRFPVFFLIFKAKAGAASPNHGRPQPKRFPLPSRRGLQPKRSHPSGFNSQTSIHPKFFLKRTNCLTGSLPAPSGNSP
jgi:hypothetical protein